jgi:hypothetical protein
MKTSTKILVGSIALVSLLFVVYLYRAVFGGKESYGASPYGLFATTLIGHLPPQYRSGAAVKAILTNVKAEFDAAAASYSAPVPCAFVTQYITLENALSGVAFTQEWEYRKAFDTLKRLVDAVSTENCLGGSTTFKRASSQVQKLRDGL